MLEVPFFRAATRIQVDLVVRVVIAARAIKIIAYAVFAPLFAQRSRITLLHTPHACDWRTRFIVRLDACRRLDQKLEKTIRLNDVHRLGVYKQRSGGVGNGAGLVIGSVTRVLFLHKRRTVVFGGQLNRFHIDLGSRCGHRHVYGKTANSNNGYQRESRFGSCCNGAAQGPQSRYRRRQEGRECGFAPRAY